MAITELERCVSELGFQGVEISSQVDGDDLSAPRLEPFWAKVEEMGVVVYSYGWLYASGPP